MTQDKDEAKHHPNVTEPPDTPFQRFLRAARHIVSVPKSAVEKQERSRAPKKGHT